MIGLKKPSFPSLFDLTNSSLSQFCWYCFASLLMCGIWVAGGAHALTVLPPVSQDGAVHAQWNTPSEYDFSSGFTSNTLTLQQSGETLFTAELGDATTNEVISGLDNGNYQLVLDVCGSTSSGSSQCFQENQEFAVVIDSEINGSTPVVASATNYDDNLPIVEVEVIGNDRIRLTWDITGVRTHQDYASIQGLPNNADRPTCSWDGDNPNVPDQMGICPSSSAEFTDPNWEQASYTVIGCRYHASYGQGGPDSTDWSVTKTCAHTKAKTVRPNSASSLVNLPPLVSFEQSSYSASLGDVVDIQISASDLDVYSIPNGSESVVNVELYVTTTPNQLIEATSPSYSSFVSTNGAYTFNVPIQQEKDYFLVAVAEDSLGERGYATSLIRVELAELTPSFIEPNNTAPIDFDGYQIQFGDIDGDGYRDIYFHGLTKFILIHGDIVTPVPLPMPPGFAFYGNQQGGFVKAEPMDYTHEAVATWLADGRFSLVEQSQWVVGDINGDGYRDILVKSPDGIGSSLIISGVEGETLPQILAQITETGQVETPVSTGSNAPLFANNLYDQSVAMGPDGLTLNGHSHALVDLQQGINSEGENQVQNHNISTPAVASLPQPSLSAGELAEIDNLASVSGSFRVSEMGAATYSIPIDLPVGTAGVTPQLAVGYSSQNQLGNMGLGWQLNTGGAVSRCRQTLQTDGDALPITFAASDRFCLDGQRLLLVSAGEYGADNTQYKTEIDSGSLVVLRVSTDEEKTFIVYSKDGSKSVYGGTSDSGRQGYGGAEDGKIMSWHLSQFEDSVGNQIQYTYNSSEEFYQLARIEYAFGSSGSPDVEVLFDYQEKKKTYNHWVAGYNFKDNSLLSAIRVLDQGQQAQHYHFKYDENAQVVQDEKSNRLTSVKYCSGARCSQPLTFEWGSSISKADLGGVIEPNKPVYSKTPYYRSVVDKISPSINSSYHYLSTTPVDFNGDGLPDLAALFTDWDDQYYIGYYRQNLSGSYSNAGGYAISSQRSIQPDNLAKLIPVDLNADGRSDLAISNPNGEGEKWRVSFSAPFNKRIWELQAPVSNFLPSGLPHDIRFGDLNSDGLVDLFYVKDDVFTAHYLKRTTEPDTSSTAYGYNTEADVSISVAGLSLKHFGGITDLNQDGKVDIVAYSMRVDPEVHNYRPMDDVMQESWECHYDVDLTTLISAGEGEYAIQSEPLITDGVVYKGPQATGISCTDFEVDEHHGLHPPTLSDINSDGLVDIVWALTDKFSWSRGKRNFKYETINFRLGLPDQSFGATQAYTVPSDARPMRGFQILDLNFDQNSDLLFDLDDNEKRYVSWGGEGFDSRSVSAVPDNKDRSAQYGDYNGDGVLDILVHSQDGDSSVGKISIDFGVYGVNNLMTNIITPQGGSTRIQYEPLNRSGAYTRLDGIAIQKKDTGLTCTVWENRDTGQRYETYPPSTSGYDCAEWKASYRFFADAADFYSEINNPFAGEDPASSLYARLEDETLDVNEGVSKNGPAQEYLSSMAVVTAVGSSAPTFEDQNALAVVEYQYEGLKIQAGGRGMLGFRSLTSIDRQTGVSSETVYRQDWPFIGYPKQTTVKTATGQLLSQSITTMRILGVDENNIGEIKKVIADTGTKSQGPLVIYNASTMDRTYNPSAEHLRMPYQVGASPDTSDNWLKQISTIHEVDEWSNNVDIRVETYIPGSDGAPVLIESKKTESIYTDDEFSDEYVTASAGDKRLGRLQQSTVSIYRPGAEGDDNIVRTAQFSYYGYSNTNVSCSGGNQLKGLLCSEAVSVSNIENSVAPAITKHFYDQFGNKTYTQTGTRVSPYVEYDSGGRYVQSTYDVFSSGSQERGQSPSSGSYYAPEGAVPVKISEVLQRSIHGTPLLTRQYLGDGRYSYGLAAVTPLGVPYFKGASNGAWEQTRVARINSSVAGSVACPSYASSVKVTETAGGGVAGSCHDIAGQKVGAFKAAFDGRMIRTESRLDTLGRAVAISEPTFASTPDLMTITEFDILGRPTSIIHPNLVTNDSGVESGSSVRTIIDYDGFSTTTISSGISGQSSRQKAEVKDALGQLVSVTEQVSDRTLRYFYDVQGNLARMVDPLGNTSIINYNGLGQKVGIEDPDKGIWTYSYNEYGEMIGQMDANQQSTVIEYDFKGRKLLSKTYQSTGGPKPAFLQKWDYDIAENGLGQIARVQDYSKQGSGDSAWTTQQYQFDELGRPQQTVTTLLGPNGQERFYEKQTYDQFGRNFQTFDAARIGPQFQYNGIQNVYNQYGYVEEVVDAANDASGGLVYKVEDMDARGNVTQLLYGDGNSIRYYYNRRTGFLESINRFGALGVGNQEYLARWDHLGNLVSRSDDLLGGTPETFKYDEHNRLISNTFGDAATPTTEITYDLIDNIKSKSDVLNGAEYKYQHATKKHAVTSIGLSRVLEYDANGNAIRDGEKTLTYSVKDQALTIETPTHKTEFAYAFGGRVKRVDESDNGTTTTLYLGSVEKVYNADGSIVWKRTIGGKAQILHTQNSTGLDAGERKYFFHDHLGSVVAISNSAGQVVQRLAYDPWGMRRKVENGEWQADAMDQTLILQQFSKTAKPITNRGFTGHEMLDEVGIIHMNGRIYDASIGRFLQADPFIQEPTIVGSLNRYSYVLNNPLNAVDPSGYFFKDLVKKLFDNEVFRTIAIAAIGIVTYGAALGYLTAGGCIMATTSMTIAAASAAGFATGFAGVAMSGGNLRDAFRGGVLGAISGAAFGTIGAEFVNSTGFLKEGGVGHILAHGVTGGIMNVARGGKFGHGFISAGFAKFSALKFLSNIKSNSFGAIFGRTVVAGIVGGTVSEMTGGKFANGARSAALAHLVNQESGNLVRAAQKGRIGNEADKILQTARSRVGHERSRRDTSEHSTVGATIGFEEDPFPWNLVNDPELKVLMVGQQIAIDGVGANPGNIGGMASNGALAIYVNEGNNFESSIKYGGAHYQSLSDHYNTAVVLEVRDAYNDPRAAIFRPGASAPEIYKNGMEY